MIKKIVKPKYIILALLISFLSIGLLSACSSQQAAQKQRTITDMSGKEVKLPDKINKIAVTCYGGASHELIVLNGKDKIAAQPDMKKFPQIIKMIPKYSDSPQVGTFDNVNIEELLKIKPDVVIAGASAQKGNKKIEEAGIPVVTVLTGSGDINSLKKEFKMIGELLNEQKQADKLVSYWDEKLKNIESRVASIPVEKRKKVYYMLGSTLHTNGKDQWGQYLITEAGGINAAESISNVKDISIEQLISWNPDVMILSSNEGKFIPVADVKNNSQLKNINAVKNGQLYLCPVGSFWWDRPSPESILGITWLAKTLYPESFQDIDINKEAKEFYKTFYNYDLSDEEIKGFLNPKF